MQHRKFLRSCSLIAVLGLTCGIGQHVVLAAPAALSVVDDGVKVNAGDLGTFTINSPNLKNNDGKDVPLVSRTVKDGVVAYKFYDDTTVNVLVDDVAKTIDYDYSQHSPTLKTIQLSALVPFELRQGGRATFDGQANPLPLDLKPGADGSNIWRGEAGRFELSSALGQILAIESSKNWQQLQDNRFWNDNKSFQWIYFYDMARDPARTHFTIKFEDVAGGKPAPVLPPQLVDKFGQAKRVDFPGKVASEDELKADVALDTAYYAGFKAPQRDSYGGLPGSREKLGLKQTGFFHIEKIKDAKRGELPVLVDPEGNIYFQLGMCSMGGGGDSYTYIQGRGDKFDWLPPSQGDYASSFIDGGTSFSFYEANWTRKMGQPWSAESFTKTEIERARTLGFNSQGAFSAGTQAAKDANFPTVSFVPFDGMATVPDTGGVIDPFANGAADKLDALFAARLAPDNNNPLIIGHFLGNEQHFENIPNIVPGLDGKSGSKRRLIQLLREKYGDIAKFNAAWELKTPAQSFDALGDTRLFVTSKAASDDVNAFFALWIDSYYTLVSGAYHKYCPNHLLLGNRWLTSTANNDLICQTAGKYLDVVSVNYYTYGLDKTFLQRIHDLTGGKPILLSEWHYGATNQGLTGGARQVKDQRERGLAYRNYVDQAAALGYVIGQEWFSYLDQPVTGRWFERLSGEGGNIGLVNVADRPYKEMLEEATQANFGVYDVLLGQKEPFRYDDPRFSGAKGGKKVVLIGHALPGMTIDGVMDNWPGLPAEQITAQNMVMGTEATGMGADFRLAWDNDNLYLFIQVKDPTPMQNDQPATSLWAADSVELFVSPQNLDQGGSMQFGDRQVLLSAHKGADGYRWYFNNAPAQFPVKMAVVKNVTNDGYTIEAAIPFQGLGFEPKANQELLFDIGLNDSTAGRRQFVWNGTDRDSGDRGAWGRARLSE